MSRRYEPAWFADEYPIICKDGVYYVCVRACVRASVSVWVCMRVCVENLFNAGTPDNIAIHAFP